MANSKFVISAREKGEQWVKALALLGKLTEQSLQPNVVSFNAALSSCAQGHQWIKSLALVGEMNEQ